jgi:hypothetical protein
MGGPLGEGFGNGRSFGKRRNRDLKRDERLINFLPFSLTITIALSPPPPIIMFHHNLLLHLQILC